jgi:hypothetical protein
MNNWTENLAEYFKDICPLIECFLTIGLEEKDFQNHFEFGEKLEAKVISQFPPKNASQKLYQQYYPHSFAFQMVLS